MIKAIIFDWEKTLYEGATDTVIEGAEQVLKQFNPNYRLALISLARSESPEERRAKIRESGLERFFEHVEICPEDKDAGFENLMRNLGVAYSEIAIVDDRMVRGIRWGNHKGCTTIWLQRGKFAGELPTHETKKPNYIIKELKELLNIL